MPVSEHDVVSQGWAALTVRIAWTLRSERVKLTRERLQDARAHVLWHLPADLSLHLAEDRAERLVRAWVARAEGRPWRPEFPEDDDHPLPQRWRDALFHGLPRTARLVLWKHVVDGMSLHKLAERRGADRLTLEAAREGLRETVRELAEADGRPLEGWSEARIDALMHRIAQVAAQPAPSLLDVVDGQRPDAVRRCVRCARAWALVNDGHLVRAELVPPVGGGRPTGTVAVLALQLHPEVRHRRARILGAWRAAFPVGDDGLLVHAADREAVGSRVAALAQQGVVDRDRLRGALRVTPGAWSVSGPLGPGPLTAMEAVARAPWGMVDGLGELPEPLPPPPSAWPLWAMVVSLGVLVGAVAPWSLRPDPPPVAFPLTVEAVRARQGVWVRFDVAEPARVVVVRGGGDGLAVVLDGRSVAEKARVATGDGSYLLHALGDAVLVASLTRAPGDLSEVMAAAASEPAPLDALAAALRTRDPDADVRVVP